MTVTEFEDTLRRYIRAEPFVPFEVEMTDGRVIVVPRTNVVFNSGAAAFITPDWAMVEFDYENTRGFRHVRPGAAT